MPDLNSTTHKETIEKILAAGDRGRLAHAYLLAGVSRAACDACARDVAKSLVCEGAARPCGTCDACTALDKGNHPDFFCVSPDEKSGLIRVEEVRTLQEKLAMKAYRAPHKVCLVRGAEHLTHEAANAFLKTLEEPPLHSLLLLTSGRLRDVLPTIRSRCQRITVRAGTIAARLASMRQEQPGISEGQARFLAHMAGCASEEDIPAYERVSALRDEVIESPGDAFLPEEYSAADRRDIREKLRILAYWYRDVAVWQLTGAPDLLCNADRITLLKETGSRMRPRQAMRHFEKTIDVMEKIDAYVNPKLALCLVPETRR